MSKERTLSIIKPDAVAKNVIGEIISRFEKGGLRIAAAKMLRLSKKQAEQFYAVHKERPFFPALVSFMCSGPVLVQVLEGEKAIIAIAKSWVRLIQKKPLPAPFALILLIPLITMRYMVQMLLILPSKRSLSSFNQKTSSLMWQKTSLPK